MINMAVVANMAVVVCKNDLTMMGIRVKSPLLNPN